MRLKRSLFLNIVLAALVASAILFFYQKGLLKRAELAALDSSFRLRGSLTCNPHIVIIEVTDSDILENGRWPWPRSWHAALVNALNDLGAKFIYFDIIFSENSIEKDDALLEEAIKSSKKVYLPFVFQGNSFNINNALLPIPRFLPYVKGMGAINISPDMDGALRRIPLVFWDKENLNLHIALRIAMDYADLKIKEIKSGHLLLTDSKREVEIPFIEKNTLLVNWTGKWQNTFKHYSYLEVLAAYKDFLEHKKPRINLEDFKDSICIVGVTAIGLYDIKPVPLEPEYPAIGIISNTISDILDRKFISTPPERFNIFLLYLLSLIPAFIVFGEKPLRETLLAFLVAGVYFGINFMLFKTGFMLELFLPLFGLFASYFTVETYNFFRISKERQTFFRMSVTDGLTGLYNIRYFKMLLETEIMLAKADIGKKFCLVMGDVDHFKHFNDTYGHQAGDLVLKEVANALKSSVRSSDIVARYGGEEMIVLLRGSSLKDGLIVAEKIRQNVENFLVKDRGNVYKITLSLGVAVYRPRDRVDKVIKRADDALYHSKQAGRNRVSSLEESS